MIRVLFIGTSDFGIPSLRGIINSDQFDLVGIITQPDKRSGRGRKEMKVSDIKEFVSEAAPSVPIFQPEKIGEVATEILNKTNPELIIVAAYAQMIPNILLETPKYGTLNIHGSLLPDLRGAVPVHLAILNGYSKTGVTIQKMVSDLDAGDVLGQESVPISINETTGTLMRKLSEISEELLLNVLPRWVSGELEPSSQDEEKATYCYQSDISKDKAEITFDTPVLRAERMIRAFNPWPVAWINIEHEGSMKKLKVFRSQIINDEVEATSKLELQRIGKKLVLVLSGGVLELLEVQLEGKQRREAKDYLFLVNDK